jgi:hypothetical protein
MRIGTSVITGGSRVNGVLGDCVAKADGTDIGKVREWSVRHACEAA